MTLPVPPTSSPVRRHAPWTAAILLVPLLGCDGADAEDTTGSPDDSTDTSTMTDGSATGPGSGSESGSGTAGNSGTAEATGTESGTATATSSGSSESDSSGPTSGDTSDDSDGGTSTQSTGDTEETEGSGTATDAGETESSEDTADTSDDELCAQRRGGALIDFEISDQTLRVWVTQSAFIDQARQLLESGDRLNPHFEGLKRGRDCDAQWTWHADPAQVSWADISIELCDGRPSDIENDPDYWIDTVGQYCPWGPKVVAVDDRRDD